MPPTILLDALQSVRRKVKSLSILFGVGVVIASAIGLLLATILLDYILNLPAAPRFFLILASLAAIAYALILWTAITPNLRSIIASRLLSPFNARPWPRSVQIDLVGNVPTRVPVGQRLDIRMKLAKGDKASMKPIIFYQYGNGVIQQEYMS